MNGQSIRQIAFDLHLPEGTVKSRLRLGRNQIKKGISDMEKYAKQSYSPVTLTVSYSGSPGLNGEPILLVEHDLIAQNILWLAYQSPVTAEEIALSIGIPISPKTCRLTRKSPSCSTLFTRARRRKALGLIRNI